MPAVVELLRSRRVPQIAVLALMSVGFAGCSADMSTRFSENSYSNNPFAFDPQSTGTVQAPPAERRELPQYARPQSQYQQPQQQQPQYQSQPLPPPVSAPQSYPAANSGVSGGGHGVSSYAPPTQPKLDTTGTVPRSVAAAQHGGARNGTSIIVGTSDTLEVLARRYNVSTADILRANGYKGPRALSPGQQLIIPRPAAAVAAAPAASAGKPVAAAPGANAQKPNQPGAKTLAAAPAAAPVASAPVAPIKTATAAPTQSARLAQPAVSVEEPAAAPEVKSSDATGALPTFRWPVRGKVITSYGSKTNGKSNDGINLAVPEGTPVKAAEDGVVAYSGNELKGYGNLVLVRHSNGYVTAYAHTSEIMVKRGDTIKRGQVIAKSGQSGEVGSPQLHFEIRKGSSPVDPLQFLNGA